MSMNFENEISILEAEKNKAKERILKSLKCDYIDSLCEEIGEYIKIVTKIEVLEEIQE